MCGIAGCWFAGASFDDADERRLAAMADAQGHRGPDDRGTWRGSEVALAHRRLAVQDLTPAGAQPMRHAAGAVLAYNGEIYNAPDLRRELEARGQRFRGHSDTEVLLAGAVAWGLPATLERANGMFALALVDERDGVLHLVRDRVGIKPLFWAQDGRGRVWFASELEPLVRHAPLARKLDLDALAHYARLGFVPAPQTAWEGVRALLPAHRLELRPGRVDEIRWWAPPTGPAPDYDDARDELETRLADAVERRLLSDVPLGAFLSGGLDSSALCALVRRRGHELATFAIGYENEPAIDESEWAGRVARHLGTRHTLFRVTPDEVREAILAVVGRQGQPFADPSLVPTWLVARLARRHVTVALSGDGADELFAGYNKYLVEMLRARPPLSWPWARRAAALGLGLASATRASRTGERVRQLRKLVAAVGQPAEARWLALQGLRADPVASMALFSPALRTTPHAPERVRAQLARVGDSLAGMLAADRALTLPDRMLFKVDAASMACSLEVRVPFLDHEVVELACQLPAGYLLAGRQRKRILRDLALPWLPPELARRPKQGFDFPAGRWLAGPLRELFHDHVRSLPARQLLDVDAVERLFEAHRRGRVAADFPLWAVLTLAVWAVRERP
jgi:asparagine synthase (glutamine-hydrolysing)